MRRNVLKSREFLWFWSTFSCRKYLREMIPARRRRPPLSPRPQSPSADGCRNSGSRRPSTSSRSTSAAILAAPTSASQPGWSDYREEGRRATSSRTRPDPPSGHHLLPVRRCRTSTTATARRASLDVAGGGACPSGSSYPHAWLRVSHGAAHSSLHRPRILRSMCRFARSSPPRFRTKMRSGWTRVTRRAHLREPVRQ